MNAQIGRFNKPYVALMDGIVMGGGVGVTTHGSVRVVTDTTKMAMPEVGIGLIPDVGGTLILSRAPGLLGLHAALTGAPFGAGDAIAMGFADHFVPHDTLGDFKQAVIAEGIDAALSAHAVEPPASPSLAQRHWIDECFAGETVADILAALRGHDADPANDAANLIIDALPRFPLGRAGSHPPRRQARHAGRRAAPGLSDVMRMLRSPRLRRGHPRPGHRQGPQPEMVARVAGGSHHRRRRGLLRAGRPRTGVPK